MLIYHEILHISSLKMSFLIGTDKYWDRSANEILSVYIYHSEGIHWIVLDSFLDFSLVS